MQRSKTYRFVYFDRCNMCCSTTEQVFLGQRLDHRQGWWPKNRPGITTPIFQCRACDLIYSNPMPVPQELGQHYDVAPEDYWSNPHSEATRDYFADQIAMYIRLSKRDPHACTALDIGAGVGNGMVALGQAGFEVCGLEPSLSFRRAAIERLGIPPSRLTLGSVENADFPPKSFDFISFSAVLEHLADPAEALRKTVIWLKPDGLMYVEVPSSAFLLSRLVRLFYRLTGANHVINTCPMHAPYHLYEFGLKSFEKHGPGAGYALAFHEYYPCAAYMARWLVRPFNAVMKRTDTGMQLAVWLRKL